MSSPIPRPASLLDYDAELAATLAESELPEGRRLAAGRIVDVPRGPTNVVERLAAVDAVLCVYLADGVLCRETTLGRAGLPELLGPGEMLAPTVPTDSVVTTTTTTRCVEPTALLVLGASYAHALARWPTLMKAVELRRAQQQARATALAAIGHVTRVEVRVLAVLWHLAETWGRVLPEGTVVPFPLTHAAIGRFVRARRPTISLAAAELERADLVHRLEDGTWLLPAHSAAALQEMLEPPAAASPLVLRARVTREQSREMVRRSRAARDGAAETVAQARAVHAEADQAVRHRRTSADPVD